MASRDALRRRRGQHEPHVQLVLAAIVVGHFGEGIDLPGHALEVVLRDPHRRQDKGPAGTFDLEHRTEARQHAALEQRIEPAQDFPRSRPSDFTHLAIGLRNQRKIALQGVDQAAIDFVRRRRGTPPAAAVFAINRSASAK
jgi:hypothetical protein